MTVTAQYTVAITPGEPLLEGTGRFGFEKTWTGGLEGTSSGLMLTGGDPASGSAGYVALEVFTGTLDGRRGSVTFQQSGAMDGREPDLLYLIVPGSGTEDLAGVRGSVTVEGIDDDGVHEVSVALD